MNIKRQIRHALVEQLRADGYVVKVCDRRYLAHFPRHRSDNILVLRIAYDFTAGREEVQLTIHFDTCNVLIVPNKPRYIYSESTHLATADIPLLVRKVLSCEYQATLANDFERCAWLHALDVLTQRHGVAALERALIECTLDGNFGIDHLPTLDELTQYL